MLLELAGDRQNAILKLLANARKPADQPPFWWVKNDAVLNTSLVKGATSFGGPWLPNAIFGSPSQVSKSVKLS
ncbi:MAG: hypothetical protein AB7U97_16990 [Pirellulales bacterium]